MLTEKAKNGISDISSSEGKLRRFTLLCKIIRLEKGLTRKKLENLAEQRIGSPFQNRTVTHRHLTISEKIGLIENFGGIYALSSEGKALCELSPESNVTTRLSLEEQAIYFKAIFTSILKGQLKEFLAIVKQHANKTRKEIISRYFSTELARGLWSEATIEKNLTRLQETGKIPTFFENKFRCMEMWLEDIGLIKREKDKMILNINVEILLNEFRKTSDINDKIYGLIGAILVGPTTTFDYSKHREEFLEIFKKAYSLFKTESDISDIKAIMTFVCVNLLKNRIIMEEEMFNGLIKSLWSEGVIKSVMLGRDGKPAYVVLSQPI
jgi:hypothetical protein